MDNYLPIIGYFPIRSQHYWEKIHTIYLFHTIPDLSPKGM